MPMNTGTRAGQYAPARLNITQATPSAQPTKLTAECATPRCMSTPRQARRVPNAPTKRHTVSGMFHVWTRGRGMQSSSEGGSLLSGGIY